MSSLRSNCECENSNQRNFGGAALRQSAPFRSKILRTHTHEDLFCSPLRIRKRYLPMDLTQERGEA